MQATQTLTINLSKQMQEEIAWLKEHCEYENDAELVYAALRSLRESCDRDRERSMHREELHRQTNTSRDDFG